ncbi:MAG: hypothetical protein A2Y34_02720 [Spirochaetes bacterium GWC1_27_15]|nr:MAG: hypothetical protein A2Z98_08845 [Spirochaetes bacterium GWB1_27_13]OHD28075.1 MAG: hypothetical protein A2Y34_02720 [Spirochaetes bacterium GWC1_27_15]
MKKSISFILLILFLFSCAIDKPLDSTTTSSLISTTSTVITTTSSSTSTSISTSTSSSTSTTTIPTGYQFKVLYDATSDTLKDVTTDSIRTKNSQVNYDDVNTFITQLEAINNLTERAKYVTDNYDNLVKDKNFPAVKDGNVIFIYKGAKDTDIINLAGDMTTWSANIRFTVVQGTDFAYTKATYPEDARLDYKIVINSKDWILDPLNGNQCSGGYGPNSELIMNKYPDHPEHKYNTSISHGKLEAKMMKSYLKEIIDPEANPTVYLTTEKIRNIWVYLPHNYNKSNNYHYVYFTDGHEYIQLGKAVNTLDYMIANNIIPPVIAVFIDPIQGVPLCKYYQDDTNYRSQEMTAGAQETYRQNLIDEIIPAIESNYSESKIALDRTLVGYSLAAYFAIYTSILNKGVFKNIIMQSGGGTSLTNYQNTFPIPSRYYLVIGNYCPAFDGMNNLYASFQTDCDGITKFVSPQGHSWGFWRDTIGDGLKYLLN